MLHVTTTVTLTLTITATLITLTRLSRLSLRSTVVIKSYLPNNSTLNSILPQYLNLFVPYNLLFPLSVRITETRDATKTDCGTVVTVVNITCGDPACKSGKTVS